MSSTHQNRWGLFVVLMLLALLIASPLAAQQFKGTVTIRLERLPLEKQEKLKNLADDLESYINDFDWTGEYFEDPIKLNLQIILQDQSVSYEHRYQANFLISNTEDLQYADKRWKFPFQEGSVLLHDENTYEPFLGFINFYVYLVLGHEYDKMGELLGTPWYEKAKLTAIQAKFDATFAYGWEERSRDIEYILSSDNEPFRRAKDIFFLGMSYVGEVDTTAQRYCMQAIDMLGRVKPQSPNHDSVVDFLQAHYLKCVKLFDGAPDLIDKLSRIDPEHRDEYEKHRK